MIGAALLNELRGWRTWYILRRPVLWSLALFCLALTGLEWSGHFPTRSGSEVAALLGQRVCATGVIDAQPDQRPTGCVLSIALETVTILSSTPTVTRSIDGHVLFHVMGKSPLVVSPGDRVRACGSLSEPASSHIPGVFDYAAFLVNRDVQAVMYTGPRSFHGWGDSGRFALQRWGWAVKQKVINRFEQELSTEQAAVMAGLVVGQRPRYHPELKEIFLRSGTMHVLVASGSNVAFVIFLWFILLRCVRVPSRWAIATSLAPVWAYTLISGADAPIVRAAIMGSTLTIAHLLRRWDKAFNALGLAAWIILIANPRSLFDVGFQMSFITVLGLMLVMPWMEKVCADIPSILKWPLRVLTASVTAQVWLIPVTVHSFHHIYSWSILSNMLVVPMAALGLPLGLAITVWEGMGPLVAAYAQGLLWTVTLLARYLGDRVWLAPLSVPTVIGYYMLCFSLIKLRERMLARVMAVIGMLLISFGVFLPYLNRPTASTLKITWVDTGRALATLIETPTDRLLILPAATTEQNIERVLLPFLTAERRRPIFALIVEDTATLHSLMGQELIRTCSISTVTVCAAPVLWMESVGRGVLVAPAPTLRTQRMLLEKMSFAPDVIACRFPPRWKWDPSFVHRFKPQLVIETGNPRKNAPDNSPWPGVPVVVPQRQGWYEWHAELEPP